MTREDGSRHEMIAWEVPADDSYPDGIKYSFQYLSTDDEQVLRYDDFPAHPGVGLHHRHGPDGSVKEIEFEGLQEHVARFLNEVDDLVDTE